MEENETPNQTELTRNDQLTSIPLLDWSDFYATIRQEYRMNFLQVYNWIVLKPMTKIS